MTTTAKTRYCSDCKAELPLNATRVICDACREIHIVKWREEHSRVAPDGTVRKNKEWMIGDECQVKLGKVTYLARIIDMSDISRRENDYDLCKLELTRTVQGWGKEPITQTWTHPVPVQSYKLRKRYIK